MPHLTAHIAASIALGLTLVACATSPDTSPPRAEDAAELAKDPRLGEEVARICFVGQIDSFRDAQDRSVVIEVGLNEHYLLRTRTHCPDLEFAGSITFDSFSGCLTRNDKIIAFDSPFGPHSVGITPRRCLIDTINAWDPDALDEDTEESDDDPDESTSA